MKEASFILP